MFAIAHLSDIHITDSLNPILTRGNLIASAIGSQLTDCKHVIIAVTGDIAYSGTANQYQLAIPFFREIRETLIADFGATVHFAMCPGNHDCDFSLDQEFREMALAKLASNDLPSQRIISECTSVQSAFFSFLNELCEVEIQADEKLRYQFRYEIEGNVIVFDCINLSWVSRIHEEKVTFPLSIIPNSKTEDALQITLMHHPFNWLHPLAYREFRKKVRSGADMLLSGHEHQWTAVETSDSDSGHCLQIEGGVLQDAKLPDYSNFSVILIDIEREKYKAQKFDFNTNIYTPTSMGEWGGFRKLEISEIDSEWHFSEAFENELDDLGMSLRASAGQEIALQDIYVFPDIESETSENNEKIEITSIDSLIREKDNDLGFVIQGDERSGRSSMLSQLSRGFLARGSIPLILSGRNLSSTSEKEIDKLIDREVTRQYGEKKIASYKQLPHTTRVLILDDIDEVPIKSDSAKKQLLERLQGRFKVFVAAASDTFEVAQVVSDTGLDSLSRLPNYRILPFGHLARTRLIKKWIYLNSDDSQSEEDRVSRVDQAEKFISAILNRGVVPAYPLYLITLLHALHSRERESFQDGGFGHYYEYIISEGIIAAGIRKDKLDEIYSYCTQLAWFICQKERDYLSEKELREFNLLFTRDWHTVELSARKAELQKARLISASGDSVAFRYPYLQYYFVARYLSENITDEAVWQYVEDSARHLYVRSRANALVFLTHFTNKDAVIDVILTSLRGQFSKIPLVQFNKRNASVEAVLKEVPKLAFSGGDPLANREEEAEQKDRNEKGDGLVDKQENGDELSLSAQLTTVFKSVEILGQILKVRYSSFKRPRKEEIIDEVIRGPLRALEGFYDLLRQYPDNVIAEFKLMLLEKRKDLSEEAKEQLAVRITGIVVLGLSFDFIKKIAEAISADSIREDLDHVINANDELAYKIVGLACTLDGQRALPRFEIEQVLHLGEGSLIVENLVRFLTIYRMHMFRTSAADIQWARDVLKIPTRLRMRSMLNALPNKRN